jgi:hypothetical protein
VKGRGFHGPVEAIYSKGFGVGAVKAVDFLSDPKRTKKKVKKQVVHRKTLIAKIHFFFSCMSNLWHFFHGPLVLNR